MNEPSVRTPGVPTGPWSRFSRDLRPHAPAPARTAGQPLAVRSSCASPQPSATDHPHRQARARHRHAIEAIARSYSRNASAALRRVSRPPAAIISSTTSTMERPAFRASQPSCNAPTAVSIARQARRPASATRSTAPTNQSSVIVYSQNAQVHQRMASRGTPRQLVGNSCARLLQLRVTMQARRERLVHLCGELVSWVDQELGMAPHNGKGCPQVVCDALLEPSGGAHGRPRGSDEYTVPLPRARTVAGPPVALRHLHLLQSNEGRPRRGWWSPIRSGVCLRWRLAACQRVSVARRHEDPGEGALGSMMTPITPASGRLGDAPRNPATRPRCAAHQGPGQCEPGASLREISRSSAPRNPRRELGATPPGPLSSAGRSPPAWCCSPSGPRTQVAS